MSTPEPVSFANLFIDFPVYAQRADGLKRVRLELVGADEIVPEVGRTYEVRVVALTHEHTTTT